MIGAPASVAVSGTEVRFDYSASPASIRSNPAAMAISRALSKHGIAAVLVRAGDEYAGEDTARHVVRVLNRSYEGSDAPAPTGMTLRKARWMLPASEIPFRPAPYDRIELSGETLTIHRIDPGYAFGELVRYDLEVGGQ